MKLTTLELTKTLDKFKDENGNVDSENIIKVSKELQKFGPFYIEVLKILVKENKQKSIREVFEQSEKERLKDFTND